MAKTRQKLVIQAGAKTTTVRAFAEGMTYQDQRDVLSDAVRASFGSSDDVWVYLADFDDEHVIFEIENGESFGKQMATYSIADGKVTLGTPVDVRVTYVPATNAGTPEPVEASAGSSCGCSKPKPPKVSADGSDDVEGKVSQLEVLVAELQAQLARYEAEQTPVDEIVNIPSEEVDEGEKKLDPVAV